MALLFGYAWSWVMAALGLVVRTPEAVQAAAYMGVFPLAFTSSVFVPVQTMPGWLQPFATNQPVTVATNALRGLILGQGALPPGRTVTGQVLRPGLVGRDDRGVRPTGGAPGPPPEQLTRPSPRVERRRREHCKNPNAAGQSVWVNAREWGRGTC